MVWTLRKKIFIGYGITLALMIVVGQMLGEEAGIGATRCHDGDPHTAVGASPVSEQSGISQ